MNSDSPAVHRYAIISILVFIFDIGKGVGAVLIVGLFSGIALEAEYLKLIAGFAAILGHIFPIYLKFKGGKGVNTALGVMLILLPIEALIGLAVFIITVSLSHYISLGSMLAVTAFFVSVLIRWLFELADINPVYVLTAFVLNALIIAAHHSNIKRLLHGNENRFSLKSGSTGNSKVRENV